MPVLSYLGHRPELGEGVQVHPRAHAIGRTTIQGPARLEAHAVLRGDQSFIQVGPRLRIGSGSTVHVDPPNPTRIGADVWVGDDAVVHGCTVGDGVRVEDGAILLSGSSVGGGSLVAAGSLVPEGKAFPENSYIAGVPGKRERDTTAEEREETLRRTRAL